MEKESFEDYGIKLPYRRRSGNVKCVCPNCKTSGRAHPDDKSLSVNIDEGLWNCHYCGWSGALKGYEGRQSHQRRQYTRPLPLQETGLSQKVINYFSLRGISLETLKKMHIAEGKEFMPQVGKEMNTVQFPYYLEGELINVKYRTGDKKFKMVAGAELIPYNIDGIRDKDTCYIVEGEMDALSLIEVGVDNVISVPNGANKNLEWLDEIWEGWIEDKSTIYIAVDNDTKGVELRNNLVARLGAERCMTVGWTDGCKDANDVLKSHGRQALQGCLLRAEDVKIGGVFTSSDHKMELDALYNGEGIPKGKTIGHENLDSLVSFETKRLMIVTGEPSSGKSEFVDEICVRLNLRYNWKVAYFSPENMPLEYHDVKLIEKLVGRRFGRATMTQEMYERAYERVNDNFFHIMPEDGYTIDKILAKARYLKRRKGISMVVLDPYNRIDMGAERDEYVFIRSLLRELTNFAQRNDLLMCLVAHPRKISKLENNTGIPSLNDISGSKDFWNMADYGIVVHRDREEQRVLVRVSKIKYRQLGSEGDAFFKYNLENGRYSPCVEGQPVVMDNRSYLDADNAADVAQHETPSTPMQPGDNYDFLSDVGNECPF